MEKENTVKHNKQKRQFELVIGENEMALIQYREAGDGILALTHTEVPAEFEGRGFGSQLVKGTFEIVQAEGLKILPMCSFIHAYLRRHPEYQQLVASE